MVMVSGVRFTGPLSSHAEGFAAELTRLGYTRLSAQAPLLLMAQLSRWLVEQPYDVPLPPQVIHDFVASHGPTQASGDPVYSVTRSSGPVALMVEHLRSAGAVGPCVPVGVDAGGDAAGQLQRLLGHRAWPRSFDDEPRGRCGSWVRGRSDDRRSPGPGGADRR